MSMRTIVLCILPSMVAPAGLSSAADTKQTDVPKPAVSKAGSKSAIAPTKVIQFFETENLDKYFYTWLEKTKYEDPGKMFVLKEGVLHVNGNENGYLSTKDRYKDYRLTVEYRFGKATYGSRKAMARSSGVFFHAGEHDGTYLGQFSATFEAQIIEGGTGDIEILPGKHPDGSRVVTKCTVEVADKLGYADNPIWKKGGTRKRITDKDAWLISWYGRDDGWENVVGYVDKDGNDLASPPGRWTRLELICDGGHVQYFVNGTLANEVFDCDPSEGKIQLQCEEAEIQFRRFELHPLRAKNE